MRQIPTPALVLDAASVRRNVQRLADYAAKAKINIRPHTKTHKLRSLAKLQLAAGAVGITAAKVSEAESICDPGDDLLVAYPPIGPLRALRLAKLAHDRTVRVAVDTPQAIDEMSSAAAAEQTTIGLLVELDVGMKRTGVQSPIEALSLAQSIDRAVNLRLDGILVYPGHIWSPAEDQPNSLLAVDELLASTISLWTKLGLEARIVSGGSTPTAYQSHLMTHLTEIRPGTYIFNDMNTVWGGYCTLADCAAQVLATVVSDAVPGQVVIDAGSKTLSSDLCLSAPASGYGYVVEYDGAKIIRLSEEHGQVDITMCQSKPVVGERVTVIPNHICPCVNLQESVWWADSNEPLQQLTVEARGKIQ